MICRLLSVLILVSATGFANAEEAAFMFDFDPHGSCEFGGVVGQRVEANTENWLLRAPAANPGMLAMFRLRDRQPAPQLVPWAGEFVGKYLISAIQACRLGADLRLKEHVQSIVDELIACQAADGYLGPFPEQERLLAHWDLWGHYHVMLALLMWHEQTGQSEALAAAGRAGDLACRIYLAGGRRPRDAGSTEMNLAIIHALGRLYRVTGHQRYLQLMREIEKDWEQEGDYLRTGLNGIEFYQTPKPRWESLHNLQGLVELFLITGDEKYRQAYLHHWHSIQRLDRRNTGGFSSGEQATGTPFEATAIETCCTIAWMALTVDALRLTGDSCMADELERSTFNGLLGAQHPSGSWWTYNTPMNGRREASHHTIVFQSRAGTPDLNCCSVNAPRGLGMLSQWAIMRSAKGLVVNCYSPLEARLSLADGTKIGLRQQTNYPLNGKVALQLHLEQPHEFTLQLRIPAWSRKTQVRCFSQDELVTESVSSSTDTEQEAVHPGRYFSLHRRWLPGDRIELQLDMSLRYETGDGPQSGKISAFRGPLLLAYDLLENDGRTVPDVLAPADLKNARITQPSLEGEQESIGLFAPWLTVEIPREGGTTTRLCDYASAGARGSTYLSWLPARQISPSAPVPLSPAPRATVPAGRMLFMKRSSQPTEDQMIQVLVASSPDLQDPIFRYETKETDRIIVPADEAEQLRPNVTYYWSLVAKNRWGATSSAGPARALTVDPHLPPLRDAMLTRYGENAEGVIVTAELAGSPTPQYGSLVSASGWRPAGGIGGEAEQAVELDGHGGMLLYKLREFPAEEFTVAVWCMPLRNEKRLGQVFSAWSRGMDDPLRICIDAGKLTARVESGRVYTTTPHDVAPGKWIHICAVKRRGELSLFVDGQHVDSVVVPAVNHSSASDFALGGNPHYTGSSEHLACRLAQFSLWARALNDEQIKELALR